MDIPTTLNVSVGRKEYAPKTPKVIIEMLECIENQYNDKPINVKYTLGQFTKEELYVIYNFVCSF